MSQLHLAGKTALVTGSTSGIGLGLAIALAKEGANIVMNGFGDVAGPKAEIEACKVKVAHHPADMSKASDIQDMMEFATKNFGGVDILVNNAGIQHVASIESFPVEKWDAIIAINLTSAFHTSRLALPYMRQKNWGRIINVASVHGLVASAQKSAYVAAKHGIVGLTKVTALETATTGVTKLLLGEKEPSMQFTTPQELGALAVFMCSKAADNVRGVAWNMDGGWAAQ
jgi:3-hydroxybutyrate dehydrogenase